MADLNALIAQGAQFRQPTDPFAQYAQMQQLQTGQNQNALAQYQLASAQRADQEANALRQSLPANFDINNPEHVNAVLRASPVGGAALIKSVAGTQADLTKIMREQAALIKDRVDNSKSTLASVTDQAGYDAWRADTIKNLPQFAASIPAQFSQAGKNTLITTAADLSKQLTLPLHFGTTGAMTNVGFNPTTGAKVTEGLASTLTAGERSTASTAAASLEQAAQIANRPVFSEGAGGYIPQYPVGAGAARTGAVAAPQVPGAAPQAPGATPPGLIPLPGVIGTTRANQAERIRGDIDKAVKPLDDMQQRLTGIQQLLATGTPLANTQIQQALTGVMNDARPYGNLMKENENFGDLQGRVSGFFSQKFAGTYSDEQRRQIQQMVTDLQNKVVTPVRDRIVQQQQNIGAAMNIPASLLPAPVGYGNSAAVPTATGPNGAKLYLRGGQWVNQ